jgi:hypothetical protein
MSDNTFSHTRRAVLTASAAAGAASLLPVHASAAVGPSQFNIDRTYPGQWTVSFSNPPINMFVPTTIGELGALMTDLDADPSVSSIASNIGGLSKFKVRRV